MGRLVPRPRQAGPCVLSHLQRRVAAALAELPEASNFVLAGGAALIARGDVDRLTRDLDFFALDPAHVGEVLPVFEAALRAHGWEVIEERVAAGFARPSWLTATNVRA
jgi:hypothetical protein